MFDVIITTYNRESLFKRTMHSFFANTDLDKINQIIISNDGSTDGTKEYIESIITQFPKIKLLPNQNERIGIIPRFNQAISLCNSLWVCEFQDDVEFEYGWLEKLMEYSNYDIDFITGYDAPDHKSFRSGSGYKIKHSSRFTQLLAKKSTWQKWFPMESQHNFPTPTMIGNNCIGSKIDVNIYHRKNRQNGKVKYLVVPNLVRHNAERYNSTWRNNISYNQDPRNKYQGGLNVDKVKDYWSNRASQQNDLAVGYAGKNRGIQDSIMKSKTDFIKQFLDVGLCTLDYGCGVGKFSRLFDKSKYLGVDITEKFILMAAENNPGYWYKLLSDPFVYDLGFDFDLFFTSNVLQHNCDYIVGEIFRKLSKIKEQDFQIFLYENTHDSFNNTHHMCFRSASDYLSFISEHFYIRKYSIHNHLVHREKHSIIKVDV